MPKQIVPLTNKACQKLKYNLKEKKNNYLRDGQGLYLEALPTGRKVWRYEFRLDGKKSRITKPQDYGTLGGELSEARLWREEQRQLVKQGLNPSQRALLAKANQAAIQQNTFKRVADEWLAHHKASWSPRHYQKAEGIVRRVLRPSLDNLAIGDVGTAEVLAAIRVPEKAGKFETAHKAREFMSQIAKRAIVLQLIAVDPTYPIRGAEGLKPTQSKNRPHLSKPDEVAKLLRKIDGYEARNLSVTYALKILPLVFTRPSELRCATWGEFDLEGRRWDIPAARMKSGRDHVVPLARQVVALLKELALQTGQGSESLLFPSASDRSKPISDAALSKALRTLGYAGLQVPHGFRHTASTLLSAQQKFSADAIEMQLSHGHKDRIRGVYNKWEYLPERAEMMEFWADYLTALKSGETASTKNKQKRDE